MTPTEIFLLQKLTVTQLLQKLSTFIYIGSFLSSKQLITRLHPEPAEYNPHPYILCLYDPCFGLLGFWLNAVSSSTKLCIHSCLTFTICYNHVILFNYIMLTLLIKCHYEILQFPYAYQCTPISHFSWAFIHIFLPISPGLQNVC
jgi:hypothetical protein